MNIYKTKLRFTNPNIIKPSPYDLINALIGLYLVYSLVSRLNFKSANGLVLQKFFGYHSDLIMFKFL